jgi:hypothetical protein
MVAQKLLEGESNVTISLIPYMIYKIRKRLTATNTNPGSSAQVQSITTLMLRKFEEEFGSGQENTIATEHLTEGPRWHVKGIPRLAWNHLSTHELSALWEYPLLIVKLFSAILLLT